MRACLAIQRVLGENRWRRRVAHCGIPCDGLPPDTLHSTFFDTLSPSFYHCPFSLSGEPLPW
jgi:hypothetical protein